ncbi:hypothetical protein SLE2022_028050 [Rubroshorea leprosula]
MNQSSLLQWRPTSRNTAVTTVIFFLLLFVGLSVFMGWFDVSIFYSGFSLQQQILSNHRIEHPLKCGNQTEITCPMSNYPNTTYNVTNPVNSSGTMCPSYFRWIHEDLRPWKETGITKDMVELARKTASFRLVIVNGTAYLQKYTWVFETRDKFSSWGIVQLLRWYPGRLPDLDMMFECGDLPLIPSRDFQGPDARPPPLFRYCSNEESLDIVFPDWSFWGWAEVNIRPWTNMLKDIKEGNKRIKWKDRAPYAYWKGNPDIAGTRGDLMKCKPSKQNDWNARLYITRWDKERREGFKESNLEDQCTHRYKIYIEGVAWSVSEKYILACDSMTLYVKSHFFDFFSRGLVPLQQYWPIRDDTKCPSLKFAVEWGNSHPDKVEVIRGAALKFIEEDLKMDYVYDYMFHLLNEYAKLLKFKPEVPKGAVELCPERMACPETGKWREFMEESLVTSPSNSIPCTLPPPYNATEMQEFLESKANATRQVEMWEKEYWDHIKKKQ